MWALKPDHLGANSCSTTSQLHGWGGYLTTPSLSFLCLKWGYEQHLHYRLRGLYERDTYKKSARCLAVLSKCWLSSSSLSRHWSVAISTSGVVRPLLGWNWPGGEQNTWRGYRKRATSSSVPLEASAEGMFQYPGLPMGWMWLDLKLS